MKNKDQNNNKDVIIFLSVLAVIGVGFVVGTRYIKGDITANQSSSGLLADISTQVATPQDASSTAASSTATSTATSSMSLSENASGTRAGTSTAGSSITYTTSNVAPPIVPFVSTPSSTLAPSPAPAPKHIVVANPAPMALTLPFSETNFAGDKNWATTWGGLTVDSSGFLEVGTSKNGTGAGVHLNGSASWTDYMFSASLDWVGGKSLSISARYHDDSDLVLCNYYEEAPGSYLISLQQYTKGKELTLAQSDPIILNDAATRPNTTVSIKVDNVNGWCSLDNYIISNSIAGGGTYLINAPYNGGIGLTMWDPTPNASKVIIKSVNVIQE